MKLLKNFYENEKLSLNEIQEIIKSDDHSLYLSYLEKEKLAEEISTGVDDGGYSVHSDSYEITIAGKGAYETERDRITRNKILLVTGIITASATLGAFIFALCG